MDCCDAPGLRPVDDAIEQMKSTISKLTETEQSTISQGLDRILADDVHSGINVPPYNNSAMDGYAFRSADQNTSSTLTLVGQALAGHPFKGNCAPGECIRIMTGAPVPDELDTVVMQENTQVHDDKIKILKWPDAGNNIRLMGEDISQGQAVFKKGKRLSPADLGLLASLGIGEINVYRKLRVAVIATGDELAAPGEKLAEGNIFESNSVVVCAMLKRLNMEFMDFGIIPDQMDALTEAFKKADSWADVVVSSGGVSVGTADYTKDVLESLGTIGFWKLAIKPGKPFAFGELVNSFFFGLPGNPVSATVTFHQLAIPMMRLMQGEIFEEPLSLQTAITHPLKKRPGRQDYQRGTLTQNEQQLEVSGFRSQGSGILSSMSQSNCYIILPQESGSVESGEQVRVVPFDRWLS